MSITSILILYCFLDRFVIVLPLVLILSLFFLSEINKIKRFGLQNLVYTKRLLIFTFLSLFTLTWSPNIGDASIQILILLMLVFVSFLLYYFIRRYDNFKLILYSILFVSFIHHITALGIPGFSFVMYNSSEIGGSEGVVNGWGWGGRFSGILDNPNGLAILLVFSLFLSLFVLDKKQHFLKVSTRLKYLCYTNICLCLYTIFMTQSRKGIVFGLLLVVTALLLRFSINKVLPYILSICVLLLLPLFVPDILNHFEGGLDRIRSALSLSNDVRAVDNSTIIRLYYITEGWLGFKKAPIFGHGINSFRYYYDFYAHNNYIELLFGVGLIGFLIYYSIHASLLRQLCKKWRQNIFPILFVLILLSMDVGLVSYEGKLNMLILLTLFLISDYSNQNLKVSNGFEDLT